MTNQGITHQNSSESVQHTANAENPTQSKSWSQPLFSYLGKVGCIFGLGTQTDTREATTTSATTSPINNSTLGSKDDGTPSVKITWISSLTSLYDWAMGTNMVHLQLTSKDAHDPITASVPKKGREKIIDHELLKKATEKIQEPLQKNRTTYNTDVGRGYIHKGQNTGLENEKFFDFFVTQIHPDNKEKQEKLKDDFMTHFHQGIFSAISSL
ncbi:MAG: hypothetical protein ACOYK6_08735, partial [Chthoniobacterales bacterium]